MEKEVEKHAMACNNLHCAGDSLLAGYSELDRWYMKLGINVMQGDRGRDRGRKYFICRLQKVFIWDFCKCRGNLIASVVLKWYICILEHAEIRMGCTSCNDTLSIKSDGG